MNSGMNRIGFQPSGYRAAWARARACAAIGEIARSGHIDLCEGFAERICAACFADPRVERARVWVEKLDVFSDAEGVGAMLERTRPQSGGGDRSP